MHENNAAFIEATGDIYTSVNNLGINGDLRVYPNPIVDVLNVKYLQPIEAILIYDIKGSQIAAYKNVSGCIDVSGLPSGEYILQIQTRQGLVQRKILKW